MDQYDRMGSKYIENNESSLINEFYERPAVRSLLGSVAGLRVLDIGCEPGVMTAWLVEEGAAVVAGDKSAAMVAAAKTRLGSSADVLNLDLAAPLPLASASFDIVVASLVMHYLEDWDGPLNEIARVLKPNGRLIMSTHHPFVDYRLFEHPGYFATEVVQDVWTKGGVEFDVYFLAAATDGDGASLWSCRIRDRDFARAPTPARSGRSRCRMAPPGVDRTHLSPLCVASTVAARP